MFVDKKWVSKKNYKEMKRALDLCNEQLSRPIPLFKVERNVIKVAASYDVPVMTINQEPEEYIKKEISRRILKAIEPEIQYDFKDVYDAPARRIYIGTLLVAQSKH